MVCAVSRRAQELVAPRLCGHGVADDLAWRCAGACSAGVCRASWPGVRNGARLPIAVEPRPRVGRLSAGNVDVNTARPGV